MLRPSAPEGGKPTEGGAVSQSPCRGRATPQKQNRWVLTLETWVTDASMILDRDLGNIEVNPCHLRSDQRPGEA